jgi:AAA family ATP:ADP antiporter
MQKERHDLELMISSHIVKDRIFASEIIGTRRDIKYTSALVNLSREFEPEVKKAAVKAMTRMSSADHSYILIELLGSQQFHAYAFETLVNIGEPAVEYLESLFINPGTDDNILSRAVRIYGKVGTPKCIDLLLNKLENQSRRVTMHSIEALHESKFQASQLNMHRILNFIVRVINTIGWNYLLHTYLPKKNKYHDLRLSYGREIEMNYELLFDLLSLIYNPHAIAEIRQLIEDGSKADISHAIELLDHIIYDDIKPVLFPIMENIPAKEVVKRLQYYFPIEKMSEEEMISSTLTRDYNLLSLYPRICAMQLMLKMPQIKVSNELVSNLFHPNRLMREVAATIIYKKDPELFKDVAKRLDPDVIVELTEVIKNADIKDKLLIIDKLKLLRQTLKISQLEEELLIEISQSIIAANYSSGQTIDIASKTDEYALFIILAETVQFNDLQIANKVDGMYELYYSKILVNSGVSKIHFSECTTVLSINNETVDNLLFDFSEMANCVLSCVEQFKIAV